MVWIALIAMVVAVLMQHLGLTTAISNVIVKIAKCHRCCAFWATLATLIYFGYDPFASLALSILMAYLSNYLGLLLLLLQKIYDKIWEKIQR